MSTQLHPEDAKLASAIVILFGGSLAFLGVLMLATAGYEGVRAGIPAALMLWAGLVLILAGRRVKDSLMLMPKPRLFVAGFFVGLLSLQAFVTGIAAQKYFDATVSFGLLSGSCFALWRATSLDPNAQTSDRSVEPE